MNKTVEEREREREIVEEAVGEGERPTGEVIRHKHMVQTTDSLTKLCLLYDVSADIIMATNEIFHERDIHTRQFLIIPSATIPRLPPPPHVDENVRQRKKVLLFMECTKCPDSMEAKGYLASHNWDVTSAVRAYHSDIQWESMNVTPVKERECCFF